MSLFPLYEKIVNSIEEDEEPLNNKDCSIITKLPNEHIEIVYLLILHHWILSNKNRATALKKETPYNSRFIAKNRGLTFKLNNLPVDLQKIIHKYLVLITN